MTWCMVLRAWYEVAGTAECTVVCAWYALAGSDLCMMLPGVLPPGFAAAPTLPPHCPRAVSYTHLRAHETEADL
eukprot:2201569-Rhodomonas_salina.3